MKERLFVLGIFAIALCGCGGTQSTQQALPAISQTGIERDTEGTPSGAQATQGKKIDHIVIIVQENRSVDDLFQLLPGANTQSWGLNSKNQSVGLKPEELTAPYDVNHDHPDWKVEYDRGAMNGFNLAQSKCRKQQQCPPPELRAYGYVPQSDVEPYYKMAETYTFADEMFQTNQGPSFPAHQYIVSGTSTIHNDSSLRVADNPSRGGGGCNSPPKAEVTLIAPDGMENKKAYPCFDRTSIFTLLDTADISWEYYQAGTGVGLWHAVDALWPIWSNHAEYNANVVSPPSEVLKDVSRQKLASVVFVTPTAKASDHAGRTDGSGPSWVASVVNAIGESPYWRSTAIIVTWDDWGGWYDHVKPTVRNSYELGFRVPMIVISPYAKRGFVSHVPYEFGSILKFTENTFGLPSLDTTDQAANDLNDCFDFHSGPHSFEPIAAKYSARYFLAQPTDFQAPDDD
jgi:phospholipase C